MGSRTGIRGPADCVGISSGIFNQARNGVPGRIRANHEHIVSGHRKHANRRKILKGEIYNTSGVSNTKGKLLNQYGKSAGINGANGNVGYGAPRGYEFLYQGKLAQRFGLGLITVDQEGNSAFFPEEPPSLGVEAPSDIGVFLNAPAFREDIRAAFATAWEMALDRGIETMTPDGPGQ